MFDFFHIKNRVTSRITRTCITGLGIIFLTASHPTQATTALDKGIPGEGSIPFQPMSSFRVFLDEYKEFVEYQVISGPIVYRDEVGDEEQEGYDLSASLAISGQWRRLIHDYQKNNSAYSVSDHIKRGLEKSRF